MDNKISHVIFDVDGLILDTEKLYTLILEEMLEKYNKKFTWDLKLKQMGKQEQEAAKVAIDELNLPITVEEYLKHMHEGQSRLFPKAELLPGAEKLIRHLHKHKIPIAVATGSNSYSYALKRQNHGELFDLFHHEVLASSDPEVHKGKPAPDVFLVAAKRFKNPPQDNKQVKKNILFNLHDN
ncbi:DgyrCDS273 [Dimorphilus gyrociliatus]|uniref:DgyrCDS273 n=1 Tax=Dimorphilus gyrociliatus TaxID=2664684 RepID=A0A7I8V484_9ANNE|nr:DgyrCDS273 [Dimorphilus gyrociliatus]